MSSRLVTIGEFARMTHLTSKALRLYHREGILVPARVDPASEYRLYDPAQAGTAQVIRRFRALGMPLGQIRTVLGAASAEDRSKLVAEHLAAMEDRLAEAQDAVTSLRRLLDGPPPPVPVEHRTVPDLPAAAVTAEIALDDLGAWWTGAFGELYAVLDEAGIEQTGPPGGLYSTALFADGHGELTVYRPVPPAATWEPGGRVRARTIPAAELAVAVHRGDDLDIDQVYAALGQYAADHEISVPGPVRETYLGAGFAPAVTPGATEIGWPVFAL